MDSSDDSDDEPMSTDIPEDICHVSHYHPVINRRDVRYKIFDCIKQRQLEWKVALRATRNMSKGSHKVFKTFEKKILQDLPPLGKSGSEVCHFIEGLINFAEAKKISDDINKPWLKETQKEIKNLIKNQTFIFQEPDKGDPVTPCMDVYKAKIQSNESLDKLKLSIVVRGDL